MLFNRAVTLFIPKLQEDKCKALSLVAAAKNSFTNFSNPRFEVNLLFDKSRYYKLIPLPQLKTSFIPASRHSRCWSLSWQFLRESLEKYYFANKALDIILRRYGDTFELSEKSSSSK